MPSDPLRLKRLLLATIAVALLVPIGLTAGRLVAARAVDADLASIESEADPAKRLVAARALNDDRLSTDGFRNRRQAILKTAVAAVLAPGTLEVSCDGKQILSAGGSTPAYVGRRVLFKIAHPTIDLTAAAWLGGAAIQGKALEKNTADKTLSLALALEPGPQTLDLAFAAPSGAPLAPPLRLNVVVDVKAPEISIERQDAAGKTLDIQTPLWARSGGRPLVVVAKDDRAIGRIVVRDGASGAPILDQKMPAGAAATEMLPLEVKAARGASMRLAIEVSDAAGATTKKEITVLGAPEVVVDAVAVDGKAVSNEVVSNAATPVITIRPKAFATTAEAIVDADLPRLELATEGEIVPLAFTGGVFSGRLSAAPKADGLSQVFAVRADGAEIGRLSVRRDVVVPTAILSLESGDPTPLTSPVKAAEGTAYSLVVADGGGLLSSEVHTAPAGSIEFAAAGAAGHYRVVAKRSGKVAVTAVDAAGNALEASWEFAVDQRIVDSAAPTITVSYATKPLAPDRMHLFRAAAELDVEAIDDGGFGEGALTVHGDAEIAKIDLLANKTRLQAKVVARGECSVEVKDAQGNAVRRDLSVSLVTAQIGIKEIGGSALKPGETPVLKALPAPFRFGSAEPLPQGVLRATLTRNDTTLRAWDLEGGESAIADDAAYEDGEYALVIWRVTEEGPAIADRSTFRLERNSPSTTVVTPSSQGGQPPETKPARPEPGPAASVEVPSAPATEKKPDVAAPILDLPPELQNPRDGATLKLIDAARKGAGPSFYVYDSEVTASMFRTFWSAVGDDSEFWKDAILGLTAKETAEIKRDLRQYVKISRRDLVPVENVKPAWCRAYALWAAKGIARKGELRLPTLREWKLAAGRLEFPDARFPAAGDRRGAALGSSNERAGANWNTRQVMDVRSFEAGAFGLFDMAGNLRELCKDEGAEKYWLCGGDWRVTKAKDMEIDSVEPYSAVFDATRLGFRLVFAPKE